MKKLILLIALFIGAGTTFASDYKQFTMPAESNRPSHTFQYGEWKGDSKFTVYYDGTKNIAGKVHFFNIPITEYHTITNHTSSSRNVCEVQENASYDSMGVKFCRNHEVYTCESIDSNIALLEKMIAELRIMKGNKVITDRDVDIRKIPSQRIIEIAVYVQNGGDVEEEKQKVIRELPRTGADPSLLR